MLMMKVSVCISFVLSIVVAIFLLNYSMALALIYFFSSISLLFLSFLCVCEVSLFLDFINQLILKNPSADKTREYNGQYLIGVIIAGVFSPVIVFYFLYRKYTFDISIGAAVVVVLLSVAMQGKLSWELSKDNFFVLYMGKLIEVSDYSNFEKWYKKYQYVAKRSHSYFVMRSACINNVEAMRYVMNNYKPSLSLDQAQVILDIAYMNESFESVQYILDLNMNVENNSHLVGKHMNCKRTGLVKKFIESN